jgi:hypothetical protein
MARTGLRMMPTSPSPSLKFRTAGFPRYGFKASLSGHALPHGSAVKPAPGIPASTPGLDRPFARFHHGHSGLALCPGWPCFREPLCGRPMAPYPRGPWLRSELCCLGPSSRTTTPSAGLAGTRRLHDPAAYTPRLRCAGALRRPARPSLLSRPCCPCVPSTLRRWVRDALPLCRRRDARLPRPISGQGAPDASSGARPEPLAPHGFPRPTCPRRALTGRLLPRCSIPTASSRRRRHVALEAWRGGRSSFRTEPLVATAPSTVQSSGGAFAPCAASGPGLYPVTSRHHRLNFS